MLNSALIGFCVILLQVSNSWCRDLSPSVVKIFFKETYYCTGTLVKGNFVVTSAECLIYQYDPALLTVVGNVIKVEETPADASPVVEIFRPHDYNKTLRYMDVAVLKLEKSIAGPEIKPTEFDLCSEKSIEAGAASTLYYWNLPDYGHVNLNVLNIRNSFFLSKLQFSVYEKDICAKRYSEKFSDTMFCAADPQNVDCFYGRGGPLSIGGEFCGINNYARSCIEDSFPASFTSLANPKVVQFIKDSLQK